MLYKAGIWLTRITPYKLADRLAVIMGSVSCALDKKRRAYIKTNLKHVFAGRFRPPTKEFNRFVLSTFQNYARVLLDFFRLGFMTSRELIAAVEPVGIENCAVALEHGRGSVLITLHLGNWDYAGSYLAARSVPMSALVEETQPELYELYTRHRERTGMQTYPLAKSGYAFLDIIRRNRILAILADRDIIGNGMPVDIFNGRRNIPRNLGAIIVRRKLPVLFGHLIFNPPGKKCRYMGVVEPPVFFASEEEFTSVLIRKMEEFIRSYPDQWFVFQPEWLDDNGRSPRHGQG